MNTDLPTAPVDRARILRTVAPACLAIFIADFWIGKSVAVGVLYIIPVLISPWRGSRRRVRRSCPTPSPCTRR